MPVPMIEFFLIEVLVRRGLPGSMCPEPIAVTVKVAEVVIIFFLQVPMLGV